MGNAYLQDFGRVDATADAPFFIRFLDAASAAPSFQRYKQRTFELLGPRPGCRFLDVGCGTGDDARALARLVAPTGRVIAIDASGDMINEARRRAEGNGLPLEFRVADALALPFDADQFDGCRCDRSLMHMPDPGQALREMIRVARSGAPVVLYEVDFETITLDVPCRDLARRIVRFWCDSFRDGWLGRRLPNQCRELGLTDVHVEPVAVVLPYAGVAELVLGAETVRRAEAAAVISPEEGANWLALLARQHADGRFLATLTGFLVWGRKP
ncbi:MAG: methyltransferase domain-containing protein [Gemmataceae bacterium]|nr:methyltransferase domain-containing protein [Gemmataceae bacterium]MDW8266068.1 methyltransferase domain-containing protein [Gemmataceae bacterium]